MNDPFQNSVNDFVNKENVDRRPKRGSEVLFKRKDKEEQVKGKVNVGTNSSR